MEPPSKHGTPNHKSNYALFHKLHTPHNPKKKHTLISFRNVYLFPRLRRNSKQNQMKTKSMAEIDIHHQPKPYKEKRVVSNKCGVKEQEK